MMRFLLAVLATLTITSAGAGDYDPTTLPACLSAAASAIGATSGRTVCACPAIDVSPSAAAACRNSR